MSKPTIEQLKVAAIHVKQEFGNKLTKEDIDFLKSLKGEDTEEGRKATAVVKDCEDKVLHAVAVHLRNKLSGTPEESDLLEGFPHYHSTAQNNLDLIIDNISQKYIDEACETWEIHSVFNKDVEQLKANVKAVILKALNVFTLDFLKR